MPDADTKTRGKRLGRFVIGYNFIEDREGIIAKLMLSGMVVIRADHRYDMNAIEYMALHDDFDEMPAGHEAPWYDARMNEQRVDGEDGNAGQIIRVFERWERRA